MRAILIFVLMILSAEARADGLHFQAGDSSVTVAEHELVCVRWKFVVGQPVVEIGLSQAASARLAALTRKNLYKRMRIVRNGRVLQSAVVMAPLTEGVLILSGGLTVQQVRAIAREIGERDHGCDLQPAPASMTANQSGSSPHKRILSSSRICGNGKCPASIIAWRNSSA